MALRIYGNRPLQTVPGQTTRPTTARVREALFNIWAPWLEGCRWLDLCAGSGVMGAEALCRGASQVIGIEKSGRACRVIQANWQKVAQPHQRVQVICGDVVKCLPTLAGQVFDLIYFDPPYESGLYQPVLAAIARHHLLHPQGSLAVEHTPKAWTATPVAGLWLERQKQYSHTQLTFYRGQSPESDEPLGEP
jgi:16S rRNA (guanine966-N2)-methyltransferase